MQIKKQNSHDSLLHSNNMFHLQCRKSKFRSVLIKNSGQNILYQHSLTNHALIILDEWVNIVYTPVTHLLWQVYLRDHTGLLDDANIDSRSEIMKYHSDYRIESTFQIG